MVAVVAVRERRHLRSLHSGGSYRSYYMDIVEMKNITYLISPALALLASPLLFGVLNKTKAFFAGRKGAPLLQAYSDLFKLLKKDRVVSDTTSTVFQIAPVIVFGSTLAATALIPFSTFFPCFSFTGDFVLLFYLLALGRFFLILSALDTGSSFEGMGASREAFLSAMAEPIIFVSVLTFLRLNNSTSLTAAFASHGDANWMIVFLIVISMFVVLLAENARIPFDDPNTHLELTMIHEVMILDNSGPDLAFYEYAASLKLWLFSLILSKMVLSHAGFSTLGESGATLLLMLLVCVVVGCVESVMARCRFAKMPQLMYSTAVAACIAFYLSVSNVLKW